MLFTDRNAHSFAITCALVSSSLIGCAIGDGYRPTLNDAPPVESDSSGSGDNSESNGGGDSADDRGCRPAECGISGVRADNSPFGDLDLGGLDNRLGFAIVDLVDERGNSAMLDLVEGQLIGVDAHTGAVRWTGHQVEGKVIVVGERWLGGAEREWRLTIHEVVPSSASERANYRISYAGDSGATPLCAEGGLATLYRVPSAGRHALGGDRSLSLRCLE